MTFCERNIIVRDCFFVSGGSDIEEEFQILLGNVYVSRFVIWNLFIWSCKKKKKRLPEVVVCMCNKTLCEVSKHLSINGRKKKPRKAEMVAVVILENCQEKISGNFIFL